MAYVKQNFVDGNVLYASELNHIEDGIADAALDDLSNVTDATVAGKIGTGAITAAKIAANAVSTVYTATIPANGWTEHSNYADATVTVSGILAADYPIVDVNVAGKTIPQKQAIAETWGLIYEIISVANGLSVRALSKPDIDIPIKILCIRK